MTLRAETGNGTGTRESERCGADAVQPARGAITAAGIVFAITLFAAIRLYDDPDFGRDYSFGIISGACFGIVLQRSRFCFFCIFRDALQSGDSRPLLGLIAALAAGSIGHAVIFSAWLVDARAGYLPPIAHIGLVSWALACGSVLFGLGMALSGSCISSHLYRLGEGSLLAPLALAGALAGFVCGLLSWNFIYVQTLATAQPVWLPRYTGYAAAIAIQLAVFLIAALWLARRAGQNSSAVLEPNGSTRETLRRIFVQRWPAWIGGTAVGIIATFALLRGESLGVIAELGRCARRVTDAYGLLPARIEGLDANTGCQALTLTHTLSRNGVFVIALVAGAFGMALMSGQFRPKLPTLKQAIAAPVGGLLLGFGAMLCGGCTVGTMLTGIMAFSLSGWIFLAGMLLGLGLGLPLRRRLGIE